MDKRKKRPGLQRMALEAVYWELLIALQREGGASSVYTRLNKMDPFSIT